MGEYLTKSGETLSQIAYKTGVSVEVLKRYNGISSDDNFIFSGQRIKVPDITSDMAFQIPGLSVQPSVPLPYPIGYEPSAHHATKNSKFRATVKDIELLNMHNASLDKNDPNANAQFVEGDEDGEVYISAANSAVPMEGDTLESPAYITVTDNTNGHHHKYYYYKLTPETLDGKHFAKFGKNMPIDISQFKEGETYYILGMAVDEDTHERLDFTDHIEIYRLDYSYDADTDTCNYNLMQEKGMQGSGQSSVDYTKVRKAE